MMQSEVSRSHCGKKLGDTLAARVICLHPVSATAGSDSTDAISLLLCRNKNSIRRSLPSMSPDEFLGMSALPNQGT
jgi:hypothetical protein